MSFWCQVMHSINFLRNVGVEAVESEYLLMLDVDFQLSPDAILRLNTYAHYLKHNNITHQVSECDVTCGEYDNVTTHLYCHSTLQALVVPVFETTHEDYTVPLQKKHFVLDMLSGVVQAYQ